MGRLIVLGLAIAALVWLVTRPRSGRGAQDGAGGAVPDLVRCAQCGLHLPGSESTRREGRSYCSEAHARLGPRDDAS